MAPSSTGFTCTPSPCYGDRSLKSPINSELESLLLCWVRGPPRAKTLPKQSVGFEAKRQCPVLLALAPRPPAVAKPRIVAKRKATPWGGAVEPAGKAKGVAKGKALGGVLPVACGLAGGLPVLPHPMRPAAGLPPHFPVPRISGTAPAPQLCLQSRWDFHQGFAVAEFHGGLHRAGFSTCGRERVRTTCRSGCWSSTFGIGLCSHVRFQQ